MNIPAETYTKTNMLQTKHGRELIANILKDNPNRQFPLILDIGCGSSNVTRILGEPIPHKKIFGLDIDPEMIKCARKKHSLSKNAIQFITEDISKPWNALDPELKKMQGQFDLIFSNYVWHWIVDFQEASANVTRLLKPDGLFYFGIAPIIQILDLLPNLEKDRMEQYLKIKPESIQRADWVTALEQSGLCIHQNEAVNGDFAFPDKETMIQMVKLLSKFYVKLMKPMINFMTKKEEDEIVQVIESLVDKTYLTPNPEMETDPREFIVYLQNLRICGRKECTYDSWWKKGRIVIGDLSTEDEMCQSFIWYYPKIEGLDVCASGYDVAEGLLDFGITNFTAVETIGNRRVYVNEPEYLRGDYEDSLNTKYQWTEEFKLGLEEKRRNRVHDGICMSRKGGDRPHFKVSYPKISTPYQPESICGKDSPGAGIQFTSSISVLVIVMSANFLIF